MKRGFTLIELLVVIAIMAILMAAAMPAFTTATDRSRVAECRAHMTAIGIALEQYRRDRGSNPPTLQALYDQGYITDDGLLVCTKTGAHYHYEPGATGNATTIVSCCRPDMPPGQRPHSQGQSYVALQVGGKLTEVGR